MAGTLDSHELRVGNVFGGLASKFGPMAESRNLLRLGIAAEEDRAVALSDDKQDRHFQKRIFLPDRRITLQSRDRSYVSEFGRSGKPFHFLYLSPIIKRFRVFPNQPTKWKRNLLNIYNGSSFAFINTYHLL